MQDQIIQLIVADDHRMDLLHMAASLNLPDHCLAAGFVRNLVWDHLHDYGQATPLNDIDLIYFDPLDLVVERDLELEFELTQMLKANWSVKNQARMHIRNQDEPYKSTTDAMSYWPELETAIGVRLESGGSSTKTNLSLIAPFGVDHLFDNQITLNPKRPKLDVFYRRVESKGWLDRWPNLSLCSQTA